MGSFVLPVSAETIETEKVMVALTLNLARFTTWPEPVFSVADAELDLCVIGSNIIQQSFEAVHDSVVSGKKLRVINKSRLRDIEECQILYIETLERDKLRQLLWEIRNRPILTIGDNMDFVTGGGMVGLGTVAGKIQMSINLTAVNQSKLVINPRILKLAKIYDESSE